MCDEHVEAVGDGDAANDPTTAASAPITTPPTFGACLLAALYVGVIGCTLLGLCEFAIGRQFYRADIRDESWALSLDFAVAGRMIVSYMLLFMPVLLVLGGLYAVVSRRRPKAAPEPLFGALFLVLVAIVVVPADLRLAHLEGLGAAIPAYGIVLYVAVMAYVLGRWLRRKWTPAAFVRRVRNVAVVCAAVAGVCGIAFWRSPFVNPGAFRASLSSATTSAADTNAGAKRPNVLWIVLDTAKAEHFSLYGYDKPTTPFLEEFARNAIVFDRMISNGIWTIPTHASMFTGRPIREHGLGHLAPGLAPDFKTVAQYLGEAGYATALFTNNPLISDDTTLARGFADRHTMFSYMRSIRFSLDDWFEQLGIMPPLPWFDLDFGAALTSDQIARWLARHERSTHPEPLLVFINYMEAHLPYRSPRKYREMFMPPETVRRSFELRQSVHGDIEAWLHNHAIVDGYDEMPQLDRDALKGQYDAGLRYLDDRIREVIGLFAAAGRLDNTLVIITADHGEYLDTHEMWSHHFLTYQDVIHIPLLIREPGRTKGLRTQQLVQLTDLFPTVLNAALGDEAPETSPRNVDLLEWARGNVAAAPRGGRRMPETLSASAPSLTDNPLHSYVVSEDYGAGKKYDDKLLAKTDRKFRHRAARQFAVTDGRYKYIWSSDGMRELYDLEADPDELSDLARELPEEVRRLQEQLDRWKRAVPEFDIKALMQGGQWSDPVLQQLKALGYVGDDDG